MRNKFVQTLMILAEKYNDIYLLTADLGYNVLTPFKLKYPQRYINAGIAEQNMTGLAAGIAMMGKTVFTYSIANFSTLRCFEQIRNDIAYHHLNVKIVGIGAGLGYGKLGMSHHATEDVASMRLLPNMVVCSPGDPVETELCTKLIYNYKGPCYLRIGKGGEEAFINADTRLEFGKCIVLNEGSTVAIFSSGPILSEAIIACNSLNALGISTGLFSFPFIKPIDQNQIEKCARDYNLIVTVEEHNIHGGFSGAVAEILSQMKSKKAYQVSVAINDMYPSIVGDQKYLREKYNIDSKSIISRVLNEIDPNKYNI